MKERLGIDFSQPSTYVGLTALAGAFGIYLTPEMATLIVNGVLGVIGIIGTFVKDK